ncbi:MAG: class I SAM-dependent methyltransferase [Dehalococcoidia bacterium]|nr:class I SAM-dependent methyltransferase [Dehalococcoidia bacterium]
MASKPASVEKIQEPVSVKSEALDPTGIVALIPMRPYDIIGDFSCGNASLTLPLARYAYWGRVYAIDTRQDVLDAVKGKSQLARLGNIEPLLSKEGSVPLGDASLDGAMLASALSSASRPKSVLKEAFRLLKKGGWAAVIELARAEGKDAPGKPAEAILEIALEIGFKKVTLRPLNGTRYLLVLSK